MLHSRKDWMDSDFVIGGKYWTYRDEYLHTVTLSADISGNNSLFACRDTESGKNMHVRASDLMHSNPEEEY